MTARARKILAPAAAATLAITLAERAHAEAVDFSLFQPAQGIPTTFVDPIWTTPDSYNGIAVPFGSIARETTNADTTMFVGPASLDVTNKVVSGDLYAGTDDDYFGIALGVPTASGNPMLDGAADFLLLQWKGLSQNWDWNDRLAPGDEGYFPFHDSTVAGPAPLGLSLSRVSGLPTADEYWQRANLTMYDPQGKRAPDPAIDPILGGSPDADSGGLTELARGAFFGDKVYGPRHHVEVQYTPENVKVWVDGNLEMDVNAPAGQLFPSGGTLALYEQAQDPSGAWAFFDVRDVGDPAPPTAPSLIPTTPFGAANVTVPEANTNAGSTWTVVNGTSGPGEITVLSGPNVADVDFGIGGGDILGTTGVLFATVRQNGPRSNGDPTVARYVGAEAPYDSGFGGVRTGVATFGFTAGGEWNGDVVVGFFPYERFRGGYVTGAGALRAADDTGPTSPYTITQKQVPLPSIVKYATNLDGSIPTGSGQLWFANVQQVVTNVAIRDVDANTGPGILFTVGASNEDNYTGAAVLEDGTWNVSVRDNDSHYYGGPDTFEADNFAFLYLEPTAMPGSAAARVTGFDAGSGEAEFAQQWGDFSLTRADTGVYQLTIDGGESYVINVLGHRLTGDFSFTDEDTDGDGTPDVRTFNDTQDLVPEYVDSPFSFAFVPFEEGAATGPGMLLLTPNGTITLDDGTVAPANYWMSYELGTAPVIPRWAVDAGGNWSAGASWTGGAAPSGAGATAVLGGIITAPRQVTLDAPVTLGTLRLEGNHAYQLAGTSALTMEASPGRTAMISALGPANHLISAPLTFASDTTVNVAQPAATLTLSNLASTTARITKTGGGTVAVNRVRAAALSVESGTVRVLTGGGSDGVSFVSELTLAGTSDAWTSTLDLADNDLVLRADATTRDQVLAQAVNQVKHARNTGTDGRWTGEGITSSVAADNVLTGLAVMVNPGFETYAGEAVDENAVIIKYTYNGDANGDGLINADDYFRIDSNFIEQPENPGYAQGDFNYDGTINADDYFLIDSAFIGQGAPITSGASAAAALAVVPEPSAAGLLALLALGSSRTITARTRRGNRRVPLHGS